MELKKISVRWLKHIGFAEKNRYWETYEKVSSYTLPTANVPFYTIIQDNVLYSIPAASVAVVRVQDIV